MKSEAWGYFTVSSVTLSAFLSEGKWGVTKAFFWGDNPLTSPSFDGCVGALNYFQCMICHHKEAISIQIILRCPLQCLFFK